MVEDGCEASGGAAGADEDKLGEVVVGREGEGSVASGRVDACERTLFSVSARTNTQLQRAAYLCGLHLAAINFRGETGVHARSNDSVRVVCVAGVGRSLRGGGFALTLPFALSFALRTSRRDSPHIRIASKL